MQHSFLIEKFHGWSVLRLKAEALDYASSRSKNSHRKRMGVLFLMKEQSHAVQKLPPSHRHQRRTNPTKSRTADGRRSLSSAPRCMCAPGGILSWLIFTLWSASGMGGDCLPWNSFGGYFRIFRSPSVVWHFYKKESYVVLAQRRLGRCKLQVSDGRDGYRVYQST